MMIFHPHHIWGGIAAVLVPLFIYAATNIDWGGLSKNALKFFTPPQYSEQKKSDAYGVLQKLAEGTGNAASNILSSGVGEILTKPSGSSGSKPAFPSNNNEKLGNYYDEAYVKFPDKRNKHSR